VERDFLGNPCLSSRLRGKRIALIVATRAARNARACNRRNGSSIFTFAHVLISLIGIFSGLVVVYALIDARWTSVFLWTTVLTSVTGLMFPW
jgi:hypothetical protein